VVPGFSSAVLHDIDLSRCCPTSVDCVSGHHPQSGPCVDAVWQLSSGLKLAVSPSGGVLSVDAARSVLFARVVLETGGYHESTVSDLNVGGSVCVALKLVVTSSVTVDLVLPLGAI